LGPNPLGLPFIQAKGAEVAPDTLWFGEGGGLLFNESGELIFCDECPCDEDEDAPSTCPCVGIWPPASWPCGGLLQTYAIPAFTFERRLYASSDCSTTQLGGGDRYSVAASNVSAFNNFPFNPTCYWRVTGLSIDYQSWDIGTGDWTTPIALTNTSIALSLETFLGGSWQIAFGSTPGAGITRIERMRRFTGATPVGGTTHYQREDDVYNVYGCGALYDAGPPPTYESVTCNVEVT